VAASASEFTLRTRRAGVDTFVTNCVTQHRDGAPDVVPVGAEADEVFLELTRRAAGVDYYAVKEVEIGGIQPSRAEATTVNGSESRLASSYSFQEAVDGDSSTAWASGPEEEVRIRLPLAPGTAISQLNLRWNCRTHDVLGRLGPALVYRIEARDEVTGLFQEVPFVRHGRAASGWETNTFGTVGSTNALVTDQLLVRLTVREPGVDHYSLRQLTLQKDTTEVRLRQPVASTILLYGGNHSVLKAFDRDPETWWGCNSQGSASAIAVAGNNLKFTHLKIVGFGTRAGRECFPMFLAYLGGGAKSLGNVLVEDCVISDPAPGNADGISAIDLFPNPPNRLTNAVVRRCTVRGLKRHFQYSNGIAASVVEHCVVDDCKIGVYFEPDAGNIDDVGSILIRSNLFNNVTFGFYVQHHARSCFDTLTGLDNEIVLDGSGGFGMAVCDVCDVGPTGTVTNLTFLNNVIRYEGWAPGTIDRGGGLLYSDIQHAVLGNNLVALDSTRALRVRTCPAGLIPPDPALEDCDHPREGPGGASMVPPCVDQLLPGYRRAWFNNRALSGQLLPVRVLNSGAESLAAQQQWPQ